MDIYTRRAQQGVREIMHPKWRSYDSGIVEAERCGGLLDQDFFDMDESTEIIPLTTGRYVTLRHLACPPQYARNDGVRRIILMSHGHSRNSYYGLKYSRIYYELGYETIIFDHRGHGVADYYPCTMGKDEGDDLACIAQYLREKAGDSAIIGLHGESMGAAAICMAMPELAKTMNFAVCDSAYDDFMTVLRGKTWSSKVLERADKLSAEEGARFSEIRPVDSVAASPDSFPAYFIHGEADRLVPAKCGRALYDAKSGVREATLYPLARHVQSSSLYRTHYRRNVRIFLANHVEEGPQE